MKRPVDGTPAESTAATDHAPVHVAFTATAEDTAAAYRRQYLALFWSWRSLVSILVSLILVAAFVSMMFPGDLFGLTLILSLALLGGILVPVAMIRWRVPAAARRIHAQQRDLQRVVTLTADAAGLHAETETGSSRTPWSDYLRWREDERVILLYRSDAIFQFIPTRVLNAEQRVAMRAFWDAGRATDAGGAVQAHAASRRSG